MAYCDSMINMNISSPCNVSRGMQRNAYILNRSEVTNAGSKVTSHTLSSLTSTGKAYEVVVPGNKPFEGLEQNLEVGTYANTWGSDIPIIILNNDPISASIVEQLANGEFILVVENNDSGEASQGTSGGKYQVYGWDVGLRASAAQRQPYGDNPGWSVTLHEEGASNSAVFLSESGWKALATTDGGGANVPSKPGFGDEEENT